MVENLRLYSVQLREVAIEHDAVAANDVDALLEGVEGRWQIYVVGIRFLRWHEPRIIPLPVAMLSGDLPLQIPFQPVPKCERRTDVVLVVGDDTFT